MTPQTRLIQNPDLPQLHQMICALAAHHDDIPDVSPTRLKQYVSGPNPWFTVIVAHGGDANLLGYAALLPRGQLQFGRRGMDMHHLFVRPLARGKGVGRALTDAARAHSTDIGCAFLSVGTHPDNIRAGRFYEKQGFARRAGSGPGSGPRFSLRLDQPPT
ncbi:MAG: GNAT family N-acetyltransferase [Pseudomonadota bacterium]